MVYGRRCSSPISSRIRSRRLVAHGSVRARDALDGVDVQVDPVGQQPRRELGRVERRAGEEQVDGDVTRDLGEIAAQPRGFLEAARREVLPDRRQPVVPHAVPRDVRVVDVPVVGERVGAGRQVVEPDAARAARVVLLVFGCGAAPGDELAALGLPAEVEARVGVGLVGLGVDVVLEARAGPLPVAPPVDEEHRVALRVDAARRVGGQPFLDGGGVYEVVGFDVADALRLALLGSVGRAVAERALAAVVQPLVVRQARWPGDAGQVPEEPLLVGGVGVPDVVIVGVVQAEQRLLDALVVEVLRADHGLVLLRETREEPLAVHVVLVVAHEDEVDRHLLVEVGALTGLEVLEAALLAEACRRGQPQSKHPHQRQDQVTPKPYMHRMPPHALPSRPSSQRIVPRTRVDPPAGNAAIVGSLPRKVNGGA